MNNKKRNKDIVSNSKRNFRHNLRKILKVKGITLSHLAEKTEMSTSKIQRLTDCSDRACERSIDLGDADKIATVLGTTLGYLCGKGTALNMLRETKMMQEFARVYLARIEETQETLVKDKTQVTHFEAHLTALLDNIDALHLT